MEGPGENDKVDILSDKKLLENEKEKEENTDENEKNKYVKLKEDNENEENNINNNINYEDKDEELSFSEINRLKKIREDALLRSMKYQGRTVEPIIKDPTITDVNTINVGESEKKVEINPNKDRIFNKVHPYFFINGEPLIVLGPNVRYYVWIFCLVSFFSIVLYSLKNGNFFFKFLYGCGYLMFSVSYTILMVKNPGIPKNKNQIDLEDLQKNAYQCNICQCIIYNNEYRTTFHCTECDICIEESDRHYWFATKCIGKGNKLFFYIWKISAISFLIIIFLYLIF